MRRALGWKSPFWIGVGVVVLLAFTLGIAARAGASAGYTVAPSGFANGSTAKWVDGAGENGDQGLVMAKNVPTSVVTAATAAVNGTKGLATDTLTLGFDYADGGHCGAGAVRFNVHVVYPDGSKHLFYLGCVYGVSAAAPTSGWERVTFSLAPAGCSGGFYEGCPPAGSMVESIGLVLDEQGTITLDNIMVDGTYITGRGNTNSQ